MLRVLEYVWCICEKHKERQRESKRLYLGDSEKINTQVENFIYPPSAFADANKAAESADHLCPKQNNHPLSTPPRTGWPGGMREAIK